LKYCCKSIRK